MLVFLPGEWAIAALLSVGCAVAYMWWSVNE